MNMFVSAAMTTIEAPPPGLQPVAVTRWSARLADPRCEQAYRQSRFNEDKRRLLLLMGLVIATGVMILGGRLYAFLAFGGSALPLLPPLVSSVIPFAAALIFRGLRTPRSLECAVVTICTGGTAVRLLMLSIQPDLLAMWLPLIVTSLFVIYLYLPVRFVVSAALAIGYSIIAPTWWGLVQHSMTPGADIYRGIMWLLLANALGFTAANALQRSQRMQYAQSLMLQQLLSTDALTGIANRRRFDEVLTREWRRAARARTPLSVLMIDVDHFKAFNDHFGHQHGDGCLRRVAQVLVAAVGQPGDLVARYGGEEFVCLLPGIDEAGARTVAARLLRAVRAADIAHPCSPSGSRLTISVGVASTSEFAGSPDALVALADRLLYAAKNAGRDRVMSGAMGRDPATAKGNQTASERERIALAG
ncbi:MAG TPA: GGDEF domain-containing protein [Pseudolabrys sp.]|nr:GGDEF domain-containing protein [Pseudolabrys sp.]